ncbi:glutathione S-transferase-like protein [Paxillus ammoniavirescens]|nr:glutathione S-transferase-like protein [Paxillus ammoniavirescens]
MSTKTRSIAQICKEKEVPYELITVNLPAGEQKSPAHLAIQPFGQVPVIDDDGFILYESRAIARYLAAKYADQGTPNLIPTNPKELAFFDQAASIELSHFDPHAFGLVFEKVIKGRKGLPPDDSAVTKHLAALNDKLDVYEVILAKQKYLAGDYVTLADLFHLPFGTMLEGPGMEYDVFKKRPNVSRWWNDLSNRPSWLAVKDGA